MAFHPEYAVMTERMKMLGTNKSYITMPIEQARTLNKKRYISLAGKFDFKGEIKKIEIPAPHISKTGTLPALVYKPEPCDTNPPIMVYFHGGGFMLGSKEVMDTCCKSISQLAECIIVNADYRLAPENKFPCCMEDGKCVVEWVIENKESLGGSEVSLVGVSGDSAGATIAASVSHDVEALDFSVLIYPKILPGRDLKSYKDFVDGPIIPKETLDWFEKHSRKSQDTNNPRLHSILRPKFEHLPPTLMIVAECDPLRDDSFEYSKVLTKAGVRNEVTLIKGAVHAFFSCPDTWKVCCKQAYSKIADFLESVNQ